MEAPATPTTRNFSQFFEDIPRTDFPALFSDQEFEGAKRKREAVEPALNNPWDNRSAAPQPCKTDGLPESTLEQRFAHVVKPLVAVWGSEVCALYLKRLLIADREGRDGFPPAVIEDLLLLYQINAILFTAPQTNKSAWDV